MTKVMPRKTPDRDSRYMGLAWIHAGFSKDPNTQVGAVIIDQENYPMGSGYNGPPRGEHDDSVIWDRPSKENPDQLSKYDFMKHAEINAIDHCYGSDLRDATLYVTALPCPSCMLSIIDKKISRVVYFDFQSQNGSSLKNDKWRKKTMELAKLYNVVLEKFDGNLNWIQDWKTRMEEMGVFG